MSRDNRPLQPPKDRVETLVTILDHRVELRMCERCADTTYHRVTNVHTRDTRRFVGQIVRCEQCPAPKGEPENDAPNR